MILFETVSEEPDSVFIYAGYGKSARVSLTHLLKGALSYESFAQPLRSRYYAIEDRPLGAVVSYIMDDDSRIWSVVATGEALRIPPFLNEEEDDG